MSARIFSPLRASLLWMALAVLLGIGSGPSRVSTPMLERDRRQTEPKSIDPREWLSTNQWEARSAANTSRQEAWSLFLRDSLAASQPSITVDARVTVADDNAAVTAAVLRFWNSNSGPATVPVGIAVRELPGLATRYATFVDETGCRAVLITNSSLMSHGAIAPSGTTWVRRGAGLCLFVARYGLPGAGISALIGRPGYASEPPCFVKSSRIPRFGCREFRVGGPTMPTTNRARYLYSDESLDILLNCGANRPGACERLWPSLLSGTDRSLRYVRMMLLPQLEQELRPEVFAKLWKDERPLDVAFAALSGRPFGEFLARVVVPPFAKYAPGPVVRPREVLFVLSMMATSLAVVLATVRRRRANSA